MPFIKQTTFSQMCFCSKKIAFSTAKSFNWFSVFYRMPLRSNVPVFRLFQGPTRVPVFLGSHQDPRSQFFVPSQRFSKMKKQRVLNFSPSLCNCNTPKNVIKNNVFRRSCWQMFFKIGVVKNFPIFTRKHLRQSLVLTEDLKTFL